MGQGLTPQQLQAMDAYWRAANYLSVGQIYLQDNPLLEVPLLREHIKPRLLGHWGTTPGLNFIYVHLNRLIKQHDLNMIYITGPGHGGPGLVANTYLEGTYTEFYPDISQDVQGLKKLFAGEHVVNLLRAEGLDTLPKYLAERINTLGSVSRPDHPEPEGATL